MPDAYELEFHKKELPFLPAYGSWPREQGFLELSQSINQNLLFQTVDLVTVWHIPFFYKCNVHETLKCTDHTVFHSVNHLPLSF